MLGYFNAKKLALKFLSKTRINGLKERRITNTPIITSTCQLLNTLLIKALLALSRGSSLSGNKPRIQNSSLKKGIHKQGDAAGRGLALLAISKNSQESISYVTVSRKLKCLFFSWKCIYFEVVSVKW